MQNYIVQVKNASFSYGEKRVFSDISFYVKPKEVLCIIGPNGCGKTTLLDCVLGVLKLKQGEVLIDQKNLENIKPGQLAEKVAYVPQVHRRTFPYMVKDIVLMGRAHRTNIFSSPDKEDMGIANEAMEKVGISHLAEEPYTQISGGQCQLVMVARALAQQPEIIIMDEPTSHLDFKNELMVLETVVDLIKQNNISVIMATHFPNHAYYFETNNVLTTLALMNNEKFEKVGSPQQILNEENIRKIYGVDSKVLNYNIDKTTLIRQIVPLSIVKNA
ncbi:MAG: ABC transporter ATP-binding protein [Natronincolaceae bacterium]|jgi:iron complex transport system ATP-binding protein|nr:ABC transporter ATP-binding protein [Bacillota bacterium]